MELPALLEQLFQGNNPILLLLAVLLFKDQIFDLFKPKPKPVTEPAPAPSPAPGPAPAPVSPIDDRPILKVLINEVLPVLLPLLVAALKKQQEDAAK